VSLQFVLLFSKKYLTFSSIRKELKLLVGRRDHFFLLIVFSVLAQVNIYIPSWILIGIPKVIIM